MSFDLTKGGHDFGPIEDLSSKCKKCGFRVTVIGLMAPQAAKVIPDCPYAAEVAPATSSCQCGAFKTYGVGKGAVGHSSWCPWRTP